MKLSSVAVFVAATLSGVAVNFAFHAEWFISVTAAIGAVGWWTVYARS